MTASPSDALVLFGVTGDLAHKMIFPALYALVNYVASVQITLSETFGVENRGAFYETTPKLSPTSLAVGGRKRQTPRSP